MAQEQTRNTSIAVGITNVEISPERQNNQDVIFRAIVNNSTGGQVITLSFGDEAVSGYGIPLNVGGFYTESKDLGYTPTKRRICAIANAAGGTIAVSERVITRQ